MKKNIIGHKVQRERLKELFEKNKFAAPLLMIGEEGIGKKLICKELFQSLICLTENNYGGCNDCQHCKLFQSGNYPDYFEVNAAEKEASSTENIRKLLSTIQLNSFQGSWKIILIDNVDELNLNALNALLKSLEEPQEKTLWGLISRNYTKLPKTIVSRCQLWFFDKLQNKEIEEYLQNHEQIVDPKETQRLVTLLNGSLNSLESINENQEDWLLLTNSIEKIKSGDITTAVKLTEKVKKDKEKARLYLKMLSLYARNKMHEEKTNEEKLRWSILLNSCLEGSNLIASRNLNVGFVFQKILFELSTENINEFKEHTEISSLFN